MDTFETVTLDRHSSLEERKEALYQIYRQVLERQPYDHEQQILASAEQQFLKNKIGVRRFIKILGQSEVYLEQFFYSSSNVKFLELCFKHFMGRSPHDYAEMQHYSTILSGQGVPALITQMLDSEEYRKHFGCFTIPHPVTQAVYDCPKDYLETHLLNQEFHGQRGHAVPTMVWRALGLDCNGGTCTRVPDPDAFEFLDDLYSDRLELLQILRRLDSTELEEVASALPAAQRLKLGRVLLQVGDNAA